MKRETLVAAVVAFYREQPVTAARWRRVEADGGNPGAAIGRQLEGVPDELLWEFLDLGRQLQALELDAAGWAAEGAGAIAKGGPTGKQRRQAATRLRTAQARKRELRRAFEDVVRCIAATRGTA